MHTDFLNEALSTLRQGGIVAMPTDTVYGLHCLPQHLASVEKIIALKKRSKAKGLILVGDNLVRFAEFIKPLPAEITLKIQQNPGITWLVPANEQVSKLVTGEFKTVAIRICTNAFIAELSLRLNSPLVSTSANISQNPVVQTDSEIKIQFPEGIDLIIPGEIPDNVCASKIRDAFTDERLR